MLKLLGTCMGALAFLFALTPPAAAQEVRMIATLSGGNETPALNTGALGTAEVSVDVANRELVVTLRVFNIPTTTTAAHIHVGPAGIAGPVVLDFPSSVVGQTGDFTATFRLGASAFRARPTIGILTIDDAIQAITGGNAYVNIHTSQYPAGEIRGQLSLR